MAGKKNISLKRQQKYLNEQTVLVRERDLIFHQLHKEADTHDFSWINYVQTHRLFPRIQYIDERLLKLTMRIKK